MTKPLLHVLGAGIWQVPTIRLAQHMGYRVLATDMFSSRPGYEIADDHAIADITDLERTLEVATERGIDGIVCDTTDAGVPTMAFVAEQLGLPGIGYETALNFTNKHRMRELTRAAGIANPAFALVASADEAPPLAASIGFPCVFKPVDNQSSRGVSVANSPAEVARAFATARSAARSEVIVEGFLVGQEVTVEGYCGAGVPTAVCISDKAHYGDLPVAHRLTYPADLTASQMEAVVAANTRTVRALGLDTGVTHAEYMVGGDAVSLVEIAARGGGSYVYTDILPTLANRQIPAAYIRHLMGGEWMIGNPILADPDAPKAANLAFFRFRPGRVTSVRGLEEARTVAGVARLDLDLRVGDEVPPVADDRSRHGLVVVFAPSRTEALARTEAVYERVKLTIDGTEHAGRPPLSPAGDPKRGNDGI